VRASQPAHEADSLSDLIDVLVAAIAARQVGLDTAVGVGLELLVDVGRHELDDGAAVEGDHGVTLPPS
jgi:hypothetical protein